MKIAGKNLVLGNPLKKMTGMVQDKFGGINKKSADTIGETKQPVFEAIDYNKDGKIDAEDIVHLAFKVPGVQVDRKKFLKKEFRHKFSWLRIQKAIKTNPMKAKMNPNKIDEIAESVIQSEREKVSLISAALGLPGGAASLVASTADIAQYYGSMLVAAQKLLYLYGFPQMECASVREDIDSSTMNQIILCLGVMYGIAGANLALNSLSKAIGKGVKKQLLKKALTKGTIYPIVKKISRWFGMNMTKKAFANFFGKSIPIVGGIIGGGMTYLSFKPCCERLKDVLKDTALSNPNHVESDDEEIDFDKEVDEDGIPDFEENETN